MSSSIAGNTEETLTLIRKSLRSATHEVEGTHFDQNIPHIFVTLGASVSLSSCFVYLFFLLLLELLIEKKKQNKKNLINRNLTSQFWNRRIGNFFLHLPNFHIFIELYLLKTLLKTLLEDTTASFLPHSIFAFWINVGVDTFLSKTVFTSLSLVNLFLSGSYKYHPNLLHKVTKSNWNARFSLYCCRLKVLIYIIPDNNFYILIDVNHLICFLTNNSFFLLLLKLTHAVMTLP